MTNKLIEYGDIEHFKVLKFSDVDPLYNFHTVNDYDDFMEGRYSPTKTHFTVDGKNVTFWIDRKPNVNKEGLGKYLGDMTFQTDTGVSTFKDIHPLNYGDIINLVINMLKFGMLERYQICRKDVTFPSTEIIRGTDASEIARMIAKSTDEYLIKKVMEHNHMTIVWDKFIRVLVEEGNITPLSYIKRDVRNGLINTFSKWTDDSPSLIVYLIETSPKDDDPHRWDL